MIWICASVSGQQWTKEADLQAWRICSQELSSGEVRSYLWLDGAFMEACGDRLLPVWRMQVPRMSDGSFRVRLSGSNWQPLTDRERALLPLSCIDTITDNCRVNPLVTRKQPVAEVCVVPFRRHEGRYEKLVSFRLEGEPVAVPAIRQFAQKNMRPIPYCHRARSTRWRCRRQASTS